MTMATLYGSTTTANEKFANFSIGVARKSVIPSLFYYATRNESSVIYEHFYHLEMGGNSDDIRARDIMNVTCVKEGTGVYTEGLFDNRQAAFDDGLVEFMSEIFILLIWVLGVMGFAGPVMLLVVQPIERMVNLLSLMMQDPLGFSSSSEYRRLNDEDDEIDSMWPKEVLEGMETTFLMRTILRIGSLMKVGFGSAGVEIIRNNLERGEHKDVLFLNKQGDTVSCIFLFCDIRQFTDATESLQEEVFVFTNKVAAVVHSICHSYGGSANKNIGDAFLVSWILDEIEKDDESAGSTEALYALSNQADKALLSVVKISLALHYDDYFVEGMADAAHERLLAKLSKRKGPLVQMGFGLHAGLAVQGAIGSQRKLDATYISESVETSEFLESSTKKYGVPVLMSDAFYNLLDPANRFRCRKVDQLLLLTGDGAGLTDPNEMLDTCDKMNIYTFDMDIDSLWRKPTFDDDISTDNSDIHTDTPAAPIRLSLQKRRSLINRRASFRPERSLGDGGLPNSSTRRSSFVKEASMMNLLEEHMPSISKTLVLPKGVRKYSDKCFLEKDIKTVRRCYVSSGIFFPKFDDGIKSYYAKDWDHAKQCFELILSGQEDGPSRYFLKQMKEYDYVPPRNFIGYNVVDSI